jgi:hypothetical protein
MTRAPRRCSAALALVWVAAGCAPREAGPVAVSEWPEHLQPSIAAVGFPGARRTFQVGPGATVEG